jgi:DNA-binding response OmpR family regulator
VRVLVVSEDAAERQRVTSALSLHHDAEIIEFDSGEDARTQLIDGDVTADVLVLDGDLQPRGGFALLYDLHARADLAETALPVAVVLTGRDQDRFLVTWSKADAAVAKPVDPFELSRVVGELAARAATT